MSDTSKDAALGELATRYLDLWVEHWAACLTAPETAEAMTRLLASFQSDRRGSNAGAGRDAAPGDAVPGEAGRDGRSGSRDESASIPSASDDGDGRAHDIESRLAELERRLARIEAGAGRGLAKHPSKPRSRSGGS